MSLTVLLNRRYEYETLILDRSLFIFNNSRYPTVLLSCFCYWAFFKILWSFLTFAIFYISGLTTLNDREKKIRVVFILQQFVFLVCLKVFFSSSFDQSYVHLPCRQDYWSSDYWNPAGSDCNTNSVNLKGRLTLNWKKKKPRKASGSVQTDVMPELFKDIDMPMIKCLMGKWCVWPYCWWVFWAAAAKWWKRCTSWRPWRSNPAWENSGACSACLSATRDGGKQSGAEGRWKLLLTETLVHVLSTGWHCSVTLQQRQKPFAKNTHSKKAKAKCVKQWRCLHYRGHPLKQQD